MKETYFKILSIENKMKRNSKLQLTMKAIAGLILFTVSLFSLHPDNETRVLWIISLPSIILLFFLDYHFAKENKKCELELYKLEIDELEDKKEEAKITGDALPDAVVNANIEKPTERIKLPILYYGIVLVFDIIIGIAIIR
jgi:hypothetical protein